MFVFTLCRHYWLLASLAFLLVDSFLIRSCKQSEPQCCRKKLGRGHISSDFSVWMNLVSLLYTASITSLHTPFLHSFSSPFLSPFLSLSSSLPSSLTVGGVHMWSPTLHGVCIHDGQHAAALHAYTVGPSWGGSHQVSPLSCSLPLHGDQLCQDRRWREPEAHQGRWGC